MYTCTCTLLWFHKSCCSFNAHDEATCHLWVKSAAVTCLLNTKNSSDPCHHLVRGKLIWASQMQLPSAKYWATVTAAKSTCQTSNISRKETETHLMGWRICWLVKIYESTPVMTTDAEVIHTAHVGLTPVGWAWKFLLWASLILY